MSVVDQVLEYLAVGQATSAAMADALGLPETSVARALAPLLREERVHTGTITHQTTRREMTVYRLTPAPL